MNIVFGGAFNPPTIAHEQAIKTVLSKLNVQRFILVPVGSKYHLKTVKEDEHRFNMLKVVSKTLNVEVSRAELDSDNYQGTYKLLKHLDLPNCKFLIGSDNLLDIPKWKNPEKLLNEFGLVVLARGNDVQEIINNDELLLKYRDNITVINDFKYDVSSTMFRKTHDFNLVSKKIKQYIIDNDLYGGNHVS